MKRFLAIALVSTSWLGVSNIAVAQTSPATPPTSITTVEDAPQGTAEDLGNIPPLFSPSTPSSPQREEETPLPLEVNASDEAYEIYPNVLFERLIGEDDVKLRLNLEREGGKLGVGLPFE
jgi:hypothetical protein